MTRDLPKTREWRDVSVAKFREEIVPLNRPAILKGLVAEWPAVRAGLQSPKALSDYIAAFSAGVPAAVMTGDPAIGGRFFYRPDMGGFNFSTAEQPFPHLLAELLRQLDHSQPSAIAAQAVPIPTALPGFEAANALDLVAPSVVPRIWIGNAVTIAAHFDLTENIACVVGGRRRFTLFPPEQLRNLYVGPLELTPAGTPISMVDFAAPDLGRHPRFTQALDAAEVAEVEAGDAVYIPYMWWHHVRSLERFNVLVNYWWNDTPAGVGWPFELLMMALISLRDLPPAYRQAWRPVFDHWVFQTDGAPAAHLAKEHRGALGETTPALRHTVRTSVLRSLKGG